MSRLVLIHPRADWLAERLAPSLACTVSHYAVMDRARDALGDADILVALASQIDDDALHRAANLKWIHLLTTGYDTVVRSGHVPKGTIITNSRGIHGPQMSELAILSMLALNRNYRRMLTNQDRGVWGRWPQPLLDGKTACVIGLGTIAEVLIPRLRMLGMPVVGVSENRSEMEGVDTIVRRADLNDILGIADFVVVLTPYAADTENILDTRQFDAMKSSAHVINLARGGCVNEAALVNAVESGTIAGAALDVFAKEPLPSDSRIWGNPNIILTPHIGGMSENYHQQLLPILASNLEAFLKGEHSEMINIVKKG